MFNPFNRNQYPENQALIERLNALTSDIEIALVNLKASVKRLQSVETIDEFQNVAHDIAAATETIDTGSRKLEMIGWLNDIMDGIQMGRRDFRIQAEMITELANELMEVK